MSGSRFFATAVGLSWLGLSACSSSPAPASESAASSVWLGDGVSWTRPPAPAKEPRWRPHSHSPKPASAACSEDAEERAEEPVECGPTCTGSQIMIRHCVGGAWQVSRLAPTCDCGPDAFPPELSQCKLRHTTLHMSHEEPSVGCELELDCGRRLAVTCDPEEDGTHTSLCDCQHNGKLDHVVQGQLFKDDASACRTAAIVCLAPRVGHEP